MCEGYGSTHAMAWIGVSQLMNFVGLTGFEPATP